MTTHKTAPVEPQQPATPPAQAPIEDREKDCHTCAHEELPAYAARCQDCTRLATGARWNWEAKPAPAQAVAPVELSDEVFDVLSMARMVLFQYHKLYRLDSEQRLIDRIDAALAAKKGGYK